MGPHPTHPYKKWKSGYTKGDYRHVGTWRKDHVKYMKKAAMCKSRKGASGETSRADTLIIDLQPPEL